METTGYELGQQQVELLKIKGKELIELFITHCQQQPELISTKKLEEYKTELNKLNNNERIKQAKEFLALKIISYCQDEIARIGENEFTFSPSEAQYYFKWLQAIYKTLRKINLDRIFWVMYLQLVGLFVSKCQTDNKKGEEPISQEEIQKYKDFEARLNSNDEETVITDVEYTPDITEKIASHCQLNIENIKTNKTKLESREDFFRYMKYLENLKQIISKNMRIDASDQDLFTESLRLKWETVIVSYIKLLRLFLERINKQLQEDRNKDVGLTYQDQHIYSEKIGQLSTSLIDQLDFPNQIH